MEVKIHLRDQAEPVVIGNVRNAYQKGDLYCVMLVDSQIVYKYPIQHIFRITESQAHDDSRSKQ